MVARVDSVAYAICEECGWNINPIRLGNFLYIAHMIYYGVEGEPLVINDFSLIEGSIDHSSLGLLSYDADDISETAFPDWRAFHESDKRLKLIKAVVDYFGARSSEELSLFMRYDAGPGKKKCHNFLSKNILAEYNSRLMSSEHDCFSMVSNNEAFGIKPVVEKYKKLKEIENE